MSEKQLIYQNRSKVFIQACSLILLHSRLSFIQTNMLVGLLDLLLHTTLTEMLVVGSTLVSKLGCCFNEPRTCASNGGVRVFTLMLWLCRSWGLKIYWSWSLLFC
jgi:hypothetical protein